MADAKIEYMGKVTNISAGHKAVLRCEYMAMEGEVVVEACENVGITPEDIITITKNTEEGKPLDVTTAKQAIVAVPPPEDYMPKPTETKDIAENGEDIDVLNYAKVNVNVPIPEGYIVPTGTLPISSNGSHPVTEYASVDVNVTPKLQNKSFTPTEKGKAITFDSDKDGLHTVTVAAVPVVTPIPTVTSNGEVTAPDGKWLKKINVQVPIPSNYMQIPTETLPIDTIGLKDVTNYAKVDVSVPDGYVRPGGTLPITANSADPIDVTYYKSVTVAVPEPPSVTVYSGYGEPDPSLGKEGDIYLVLEE